MTILDARPEPNRLANRSAEFPDVWEAHLDPFGLRELFDDLGRDATILGVRLKGGPRDLATESQGLASAFDALSSLLVRGAQIEYRFDGEDWVDTVMPTTSGFRVVRMRGSVAAV